MKILEKKESLHHPHNEFKLSTSKPTVKVFVNKNNRLYHYLLTDYHQLFGQITLPKLSDEEKFYSASYVNDWVILIGKNSPLLN